MSQKRGEFMWKNNKYQWTKKRKRRGEIIAAKLAKRNYTYKPSREAISFAYYESHVLKYRYGKDLLGVQAFEEVIMFLRTFRIFQSPDWYELALRVTLEKLKGKRFINEREEADVVKNTSDVNQIIREALRTAGIKAPVQRFVMERARQ